MLKKPMPIWKRLPAFPGMKDHEFSTADFPCRISLKKPPS